MVGLLVRLSVRLYSFLSLYVHHFISLFFGALFRMSVTPSVRLYVYTFSLVPKSVLQFIVSSARPKVHRFGDPAVRLSVGTIPLPHGCGRGPRMVGPSVIPSLLLLHAAVRT